MNLYKVLAFNGVPISTEIIATSLHFLWEPGEHKLGYGFLLSTLEGLNQILPNPDLLTNAITELKNHINSENGAQDSSAFEILSRLKIEEIPIDLVIKFHEVIIIIEICTRKSDNDKLESGYLKFIDNNPFNSNQKIICCKIGVDQNTDYNSWSDILRTDDQIVFLPLKHPDSSINTLNAFIFNFFRTFDCIPGVSFRHTARQRPLGLMLLNNLWEFFEDDLQGYGHGEDISKMKGISFINSIELENKNHGYVYFRNGFSGLLRLHPDQIHVYQFAYISIRPNSHGWVEIKRVQAYLKWFLNKKNFRRNSGNINSELRDPSKRKKNRRN